MSLEGDRKVKHGLLQEAALGANLVCGDRLEVGAERGVEYPRVRFSGRCGRGRERVAPREQRDSGAGKHDAGTAEEGAACGDAIGSKAKQQERHFVVSL